MYALILLTEMTSKLDCYEVLTLMLSALCHDLDHPGYNNTYQVPLLTPAQFTIQSNSSMHHYGCVGLCKDISLQRGRFCASLMYPKIQLRQVIMNVLHPSCAWPLW